MPRWLPYHHRVKTHPDWNVTSPEPGTCLWTTPTGHTYRRDPEPPLDPPVYDEDYPTLQPADLEPTDPPMLETTAPENQPEDPAGAEPPPEDSAFELGGPDADSFGLAS